MSFSLRSFSSLVQNAVVTAQAHCAQKFTLDTGTPGRALIESVAALGLWLQYLLVQILCRTRLATSVGADCDSFVGDFGMTRLPGVKALGSVTMTCFSYGDISAVVRPGVTVRTASAITFQVVTDTAHECWSAETGGYVRPAGMASLTLPVEALVEGVQGNVAIGAISLMGTSVAGIDIVTNHKPFANGSDQETDTQLRERFPLWLASKATASRAAVESAIAETQNNLSFAVFDGQEADGSLRPGYFTVVVDDGSEYVPEAVLQKIHYRIEAIKALGIGFAVQRPVMLTVMVAMKVLIAPGADAEEARTALVKAISADITSVRIGASYPFSRLSYVAYVGAGVSVLSVTDILLNGSQNDIPAQTSQSLFPGTISVQVVQEG
ncbi:baseplate J/gp47 family protein [Asaia prunellae]|uniref:baseplate J/gp47 family protein n=1 Tax=Asaia prunellae TaxID=610245 RepID=UPI00047098FD|nr:baseplate J/gp47 family protein [Asaia prunellae]